MRIAVYFIVGVIALIFGGTIQNLPLAVFGWLAVLVAFVLFCIRLLSAIENISAQLTEISDKMDILAEKSDTHPPLSN
jgi:uncharacterized membrane protein